MKKEIVYRTVWAKMPLSEEELKKIPHGHEIRPYLIVAEEKDFYYALPCTSKVFKNKNRYTNSQLILRGQNTETGKSLVQLNQICKLPKRNIITQRGTEHILSQDEINELAKKIKCNSKFIEYPQSVIDNIESYNPTFCIDDLIVHNNQLYIIISKIKYQTGFYCLAVSTQPFNKAIMVEADTNRYYVNINEVHHIIPNPTTEYKSIIHGFRANKELFLDDIKPYLKSLQWRTQISPMYHYTSTQFYENQQIPFGMLQPGTVISYQEDSIDKKIIILKTDSNNQVVLEGLANQMYKDYSISYYPKDYQFPFKVENTLSEERVETLIRKKLNIEPKKLQYI